MSNNPHSTDVKMLPGESAGAPAPSNLTVAATSSPASNAAAAPTGFSARQLSELPKDELEALAEEYGLDPTRSKTRQHLVSAIHDRRQMIASMDRDAMLDVVRWGRRPVSGTATREQLAVEIARIRLMRFAGLSQRGLVVLARLRRLEVEGNEPVPVLVRKLKKQEGFFSRLNRRRRAVIGSIVSNMLGEDEGEQDYQYLPPQANAAGPAPVVAPPPRDASIKEEIEESGLFGGLASRVKRSADSYINQKLDEIESRIDRKLDEIDRRLAEWRDKEIANRIRILKITLWASVIVGAVSLIYAYVTTYLAPR